MSERARAVIRANSVLPAEHRQVTLETADGLRLVAQLALPPAGPPVGTLICLHPLPTAGGSMDSHLLRKMAWRLPFLAHLAVLRLNTRGTASSHGRSEGSFDDAVGERFDVLAGIEYAEFADLPSPWLVGWSFGTDLVLRYGCDPSVAGAILISPPLRYSSPEDLAVWAAVSTPLVAIVPEHDDYLQPAEARRRFSVVPQTEVVGVPRAQHLFVGHAETVLDEIVRRVAPSAYPLPREVDADVTMLTAPTERPPAGC